MLSNNNSKGNNINREKPVVVKSKKFKCIPFLSVVILVATGIFAHSRRHSSGVAKSA